MTPTLVLSALPDRVVSRLLEDTSTGCWEWSGCRNKCGYGYARVQGKLLALHRAAWQAVHGAIPAGLCVLHKCDNPPCCNPGHLFLGTHQDNMRDRDAKGRQGRPRGEANRAAKITADVVRDIRSEYAAGGCSYNSIGCKHGISGVMVGNIVRRTSWVHVALVLLSAMLSAPTAAQPRGDASATQLVLAMAAVGECDFLLPDCHAATWFTLDRRLNDIVKPRWPSRTLDWMTIAYCAVFRGKMDPRKRWVRGLLASGDKPDGWPTNLDWDRYAPKWAAIYERAGAFLRGEVADPCKGAPVHLGGLIDRARMSPHKWQMVRCGRTGDQRFWELRS